MLVICQCLPLFQVSAADGSDGATRSGRSDQDSSSSTSSCSEDNCNATYVGLIRRSEGNTLIVFASLTLAMLVLGPIGICIARKRSAVTPMYGRLRRVTRRRTTNDDQDVLLA